MTRRMACALAAASLAVLAAGCASATSTASTPPAPATHAAAPAASPSCKLTTTFDYLVRTVEPGLQASAQAIGNVDYSACADSLTTFQAEAGQADGECTTIALASKNPGYDANAVPAPPLHHVIMSAGPGC